MTRHLHRDYSTAFCGLDAAHILMTYVPEESDCEACFAAKQAQEDEAAAKEAERERLAKEAEAIGAEQMAAMEGRAVSPAVIGVDVDELGAPLDASRS